MVIFFKKNEKMKNCTARDTPSSSAAALRDGVNPSLLSAIVGVTVSCVTLCWYQREHDQVQHHSFPVFLSSFLVLCVVWSELLHIVEGLGSQPHLSRSQGAVMFGVGAWAGHDRDPECLYTLVSRNCDLESGR